MTFQPICIGLFSAASLSRSLMSDGSKSWTHQCLNWAQEQLVWHSSYAKQRCQRDSDLILVLSSLKKVWEKKSLRWQIQLFSTVSLSPVQNVDWRIERLNSPSWAKTYFKTDVIISKMHFSLFLKVGIFMIRGFFILTAVILAWWMIYWNERKLIYELRWKLNLSTEVLRGLGSFEEKNRCKAAG